MNHDDERDYAEEAANRAEMEREHAEEAEAERAAQERENARRDGSVIGWCHV